MKKLELKNFSNNKFFSIFIKSIVVICAIVGIVVTFASSGFMSASALLFFTIQSNIWVLSIFIVFLIFNLLQLRNPQLTIPNWLITIKFAFTSAICLTFIVFSVILTPQMIFTGNSDYLFSVGNLCVHNLVPLIAICDWCLFDYKFRTTKYTYIWGIVMPLYYCIFALLLSTTNVDFGEGKHVPYFFFDYVENTWFQIGNGKFGTFYWIIILVAIVFAISWLLIYVKNKIAKHKVKLV